MHRHSGYAVRKFMRLYHEKFHNERRKLRKYGFFYSFRLKKVFCKKNFSNNIFPFFFPVGRKMTLREFYAHFLIPIWKQSKQIIPVLILLESLEPEIKNVEDTLYQLGGIFIISKLQLFIKETKNLLTTM